MELFLDIIMTIFAIIFSLYTAFDAVKKDIPKWIIIIIALLSSICYPFCLSYLIWILV